MKEHPILFSGPMVRAILEGRKTQTRRIVKPVPEVRLKAVRTLKNTAGDVGALFTEHDGDLAGQHGSSAWSRHGNPGDRLWVRETFALEATDKLYQWHLDGRPHQQGDDREEFSITVPHYRATDQDYGLATDEQFDNGDTRTRWKPSLFMPRWASRITLEVVRVRVERLNAISEEDAWAEGIEVKFCEAGKPCTCESNPVGEYADLWESINGPGSWALNPWVWVIEFKRITP